jgi:putative sterol carrier protein
MEFFDRLVADPPAPLRRLNATIRFDLHSNGNGTRHWLLSLKSGEVTVSHRRDRADAIVRTDARLFDRLVRGEANAMAAMLRGQIAVEGDPRLLVAFQRVLPGPPGGHHE